MRFSRYAVYHLPQGTLGEFGSSWLGWDARQGRALPPAGAPAAWVETPLRYGFHATMKAPFRLADGTSPDQLGAALETIAARHAPFQMAMQLSRDWGFLALRPAAAPPQLAALEAALVRDLDRFRAPLSAAETARRRPQDLPAPAREHLNKWGYPFVLDMFNYHLTLTGPLPANDLDHAEAALPPRLAPLLAQPMPLGHIALTGEDADGYFHLIAEFPLTASCAI